MKILFIGNLDSSFERRDYEMLREAFDVKPVSFPSAHDYLDFIKSCLRLPSGIIWCDVVFAWFAGLHTAIATVLAKVFGKKIVVVTGGWDVENMPEIDYGAYCHPIEKIICGFVFHHADVLLPFSSYAKQRLLSLWKPKCRCVHVDLFCDTEKYYIRGGKNRMVLTVAQVKRNNLKRKGLINFVKTARYLKDVKFVIVGKWMDGSIRYLMRIAPANVEFKGYLPENELIEMYQKAKVYCQLSYQEGEGAGGALGEAMACGCIPVVTYEAKALRETIGRYGFYTHYGSIIETAENVRKALETQNDFSKKVREQVKKFSKEKRLRKIKKIMEELVR